MGGDRGGGDGRAHRPVAGVADKGDRADPGSGHREVRGGGGAAAESGDGISADGGAGATPSAVPAEYEAEPGYRRSAGGPVRQAAADAARRVPADGLHQAGRLRVRPADTQV